MIECLPSCIIFDLDGTLVDSLPGIEHSVRAAFSACGLPLLKSNLRKMIGPPIRTILSCAGETEDARLLDRLEDTFRASYDSEGWRKTTCFDAVESVLYELHRQDYKLSIVSNKPRHISMKILETLKILGLFETIITRDSHSPSYAGKEEMIRVIMDSHRVAPAHCLMAGDTMEDAKAAKAVGVKFAYMTHGYGEIPEAPPLLIDYRFDSFLQFLLLMTKEPAND